MPDQVRHDGGEGGASLALCNFLPAFTVSITKKAKIFPSATFPCCRNPCLQYPHPVTDTPQGVAARRDRRWRCKRKRGLFIVRVGQRYPPGGNGRKGLPVADRLADPSRCPTELSCRRVYRQLIVWWSNAAIRMEAKVRRYTGTRCICPATVDETAVDGSQEGKAAPTSAKLRTFLQRTDRRLRRPPEWASCVAKAGVAELAGRCSGNRPSPPGWEGSDLDHVRPVLRQGV